MKPRPTRTAVYLLATQLVEQVATLHFPAFGAVRTMSAELELFTLRLCSRFSSMPTVPSSRE